MPLLDTKQLGRLAGGRKEESYWPVAVAHDKFHCIILKGGDREPYFPRPLLSEFNFKIPLRTASDPVETEDDHDGDGETVKLEESFVRQSLSLDLLDDLHAVTRATSAERTRRARAQAEVDKVLLQLLAIECREGEDRGMKALGIVGLMKDGSGKMLEAACKVAARYDRTILAEKIRELAELRLAEVEDD